MASERLRDGYDDVRPPGREPLQCSADPGIRVAPPVVRVDHPGDPGTPRRQRALEPHPTMRMHDIGRDASDLPGERSRPQEAPDG